MRRLLSACALVLTTLLGGAATAYDLQAAADRLTKEFQAHPEDAEVATRLGQLLMRLGHRAEAQAAYRRAIALAPGKWVAYARLADLLATDPRRFEQRGEIAALLKAGLDQTVGDVPGRRRLSLSLANFERAVGQTGAARARVQALEVATLPAELRKRVLDLSAAIAQDEEQGALRDWPEPPITDALQRELAEAERLLQSGDAQSAVLRGERLVLQAAGWRGPLWLRARALESLGRFDDAERELTILLQLAPSHAEAWRRLGILLATHGGALDAERGDAALRHALALEPGYIDLWLLRAQVALRQSSIDAARQALGRYLQETLEQAPEQAESPEVLRLQQAVKDSSGLRRRPTVPPRSAAATAKAQELYRQATDWLQSGDPVGLAPELLAAALADSPGYLDAAATTYALSGQVPPATVAALWPDGEALLGLGRQIRALSSSAETRHLVRPWLDRAIALGISAAHFERGTLLIDDNDLQGGLADLRAYVAAAARPAALAEARVLLAAVDGHGARDAVLTRANSLLFAERPQEAAAALGDRCTEHVPKERLRMLGIVHEWAGELPLAVACYRQILHQSATDGPSLQRLAAVAARAPLVLTQQLEPELKLAVLQNLASAHWALARLLLARGETEQALVRINSFLLVAPPHHPSRAAAVDAQTHIISVRTLAQRQVMGHRLAIGAAALLLLSTALLWLLRGRSLVRTLLRRPALFPEVARTIGELRHDVLKHRTSALGLVATDPGVHEQVRQMLCEPELASALVSAAYGRLQTAARAHRIRLRPQWREPIFGPLGRDLRRAEALLRAPRLSRSALLTLQRVDARLRELHSERLGALLRKGPRTRVDAALIASWIRAVEAELRVRAQRWISPVLLLEGMELEFPIERTALMTLFFNLLRNAQAAVATQPSGASILVRVGEERDATGRRLMVLLVGDSALSALSIETIERRESGRGLAILRDLVHEWRGHLVVRAESAPWKKGVGACFPA